VAQDGGRYHLKVNHVSKVTVILEVLRASRDLDVRWASEPASV
jgi:hypothetical protein